MTCVYFPEPLRAVPYNGACIPGRVALADCASGANCQLFAYALLAHYGICVPPWRSSDLWADTSVNSHVTSFESLDLLLWNRTPQPWSAHVGVYLGEGQVAHLSRKVGFPALWPLERFLEEPEYRVLIGAKRLRDTRTEFATDTRREAQ